MAYSNEQKELALTTLEANGGDIDKTAQDCNINARTIRRWSNGEYVTPEIVKNVKVKKEELADTLERLARTLAGACFDKIGSASLQQATTSLAIAVDKMQLLREKPTAITQHNDSAPTKPYDEYSLDELQKLHHEKVGHRRQHWG